MIRQITQRTIEHVAVTSDRSCREVQADLEAQISIELRATRSLITFPGAIGSPIKPSA